MKGTASGDPQPGVRVELHTHLEGSIAPERLVALSERHGLPHLPAACLDASGQAFVFTGFHGFLELYKHVTSVIRTPRDFHELALDLAAQLQADRVVYAEVSVSYGVMIARGIDPAPVQAALFEASAQASAERGLTMRWIPDAVRQFGPVAAARAWEAAGRCGRALGVVGFGLGGDETNGPASLFAPLFGEVRAEGLGVSIHAGEVKAMGALAVDSIRQAIDACGAQRLGHGLAAADDPALLAELSSRGVFVELCPRSNVATGVIAELAAHPLRAFLDAGVPCCLNTDDRTLFGLDLESEYGAARNVFGLTPEIEAGMQTAAFRAAFDPEEAARRVNLR